MRNVMIVDDESLVRIGLQSIIDWEQHGYRITGAYKNGEEALAAARRQPFDIVLTDIKMPVMDGFELIRELRQAFPHIQVIILSSYNDFEHTRQAIRLGVKDYISKYEMEPEELLRVLTSLPLQEAPMQQPVAGGSRAGKEGHHAHGREEEQLQGEMSRLLVELHSEQGIGQTHGAPSALPDSQAASGQAGGRQSDGQTAHGGQPDTQPSSKPAQQAGGYWASAYPLLAGKLGERGAFRWVVLLPHPRASGYAPEQRRAMQLLAVEMFARLHAPLLGEQGGKLHGCFPCILTGDDAPGIQGGRQEYEVLAGEWASEFEEKLNISLAIGFSEATVPEGNWRAAYEGAQAAADWSYFFGRALLREEIAAGKVFSEQEWLDLYKEMKQRIRFMQFGLLADEMVQWLDERLLAYKPAEWVRLGVAAATQLADFLIEQYDPDPAELREHFGARWPLGEAAAAVRTAADWRELMQAIAQGAQEIVAKRQAKGGWLDKVKAYIQAHYAEPIRLEEVAQLANFSENHFSQRFRQETGQLFSDYIAEVRIREAVRLFRDTDLGTDEIAERVGYANPNYFIKVFKRITGQTVKHFKNNR